MSKAHRILLVGNDGSAAGAGQGGGACIARTKRFHAALSMAGFDVDVCSPHGNRSSVCRVERMLRKSSYACIVAISPHPAEHAVLTGTRLPMWIDINGMHPAEIQLSGDSAEEPRLEMIRILSLQNTLLSRGDFFSTPSIRQTYAVLGELYLLGRLDSGSRTRIPVRAIPHCAVSAPISTGPTGDTGEFSIISTGSFNSWFDGNTLFSALEYAMERNPNITFTAAGGSVPFAREQYDSFLERLSRSSYKDRFRITGWVSAEELEEIQKRASAAVYTDFLSGETLLGARTRVLDWVSRGIPVVCTTGAEISETVKAHGLGIAVPPESPETLGEAFLELADDASATERIRLSQERWRQGEGNIKQVFKPLIEWCTDPVRLPGKQLCSPTVAKVSSAAYRKKILDEIRNVDGSGQAIKFLWRSTVEKFRKQKT